MAIISATHWVPKNNRDLRLATNISSVIGLIGFYIYNYKKYSAGSNILKSKTGINFSLWRGIQGDPMRLPTISNYNYYFYKSWCNYVDFSCN